MAPGLQGQRMSCQCLRAVEGVEVPGVRAWLNVAGK